MRPRASTVVMISACLAVALAACGASKPKAGRSPTPSPTATRSFSATLSLGEALTTESGNIVTVHAFDARVEKATPSPGVVYGAADVEACSGPTPRQGTGVSARFFLLETADNARWRPVAAGKKPELKDAILDAKQCARGWLTFAFPSTATPSYVILSTTTAARWRV